MEHMGRSYERARRVIGGIVKIFLVYLRQKNRTRLIRLAWQVLVTQGWRELGQQLLQFAHVHVTYDRWIALHGTLHAADRQAIRSHIASFVTRPSFSILMPTYNTPVPWLRRAIESVRQQIYPHWELCIADDASTDLEVRQLLADYAELDPRIRVKFRDSNGHISVASNTALGMATADFIALLDHDDELAEHALYMVAAALNEHPLLDLIYSDEDKIDASGHRFGPYFKPDWNPTLFTAQNYISHLGVYRTTLVRSVGGFREGYEGSQDWDLALRVIEATDASRIHHIPHVLYHWRAVEGSTATSTNEKPYATLAAQKALCEHLERTRTAGSVSQARGGYFRVTTEIPYPPPLVSIIIPTRNGVALLRRCIESVLEKTHYKNYEILVVDNQSDEAATLTYLEGLARLGQVRVLRDDNPFNFSTLNNFAVQAARGSYLCLMNNDMEVISENWLNEMLSLAAHPDTGAVGAKLYYPDDTIQHAGVVLGMGGIAGHLYRGAARDSTGYMTRLALPQNMSAVTAACLVVRKAVFEEVGGLNEQDLAVAFNDVDFCLRVQERGYRNVWTPYAELYHHESATRGLEDTPEKQTRFQREVAYMRARWGHLLTHDPAYNPNLTLDNNWPWFARVPRVQKPWVLTQERSSLQAPRQ